MYGAHFAFERLGDVTGNFCRLLVGDQLLGAAAIKSQRHAVQHDHLHLAHVGEANWPSPGALGRFDADWQRRRRRQ